ncbi:hypothetical protein VNI00_015221 [Paramarasmius palmivorus]|uniref:F-box domain-containing protein n=1 Tax=Paramarasmius palmivorus TaxID=297713 RepID=A0AAW0BLM8_9AGAR
MFFTKRLPYEVWENVAAYSSLSNLSTLSLLSKEFNLIAVSQLYRKIEVEDMHRTVMCLKTLARNDHAAKSVREFSCGIKLGSYPEATVLASFFRLLARSLRRLVHVKSLNLRPYSSVEPSFPRFDFLFNDCTFPHLVNLQISTLHMSPHVTAFLSRHQSHLVTLVLFPFPDQWPEECFGANALRCLTATKKLTTCPVAAAHILASAQLPTLEILSVSWIDDRDYVPFISAARRFFTNRSGGAVPKLNLRRYGWNGDLIRDLSIQVPNLTVLLMNCYGMPHGDELPEDEEMIFPNTEIFESVAESISRFHNLSAFAWSSSPLSSIPPCHSPQFEYEYVLRLKAGCPDLRLCRIPYGVYWKHISDDLWQTKGNSLTPDSAVYRWIFTHLSNKTHPAQGTLLRYLRDRLGSSSSAMKTIIRYQNEQAPVSRDTTLRMMAYGTKAELWS